MTTCDGRYVGLFDPAKLSPAEDALSGAPFGRRSKHTCCVADGLTKIKLLVEDALVSEVEEVELSYFWARSRGLALVAI